MAEDPTPEVPPTFEDGQDIRDRTFAFACRVVEYGEKLHEARGVGRLMVPQLLSCSLSLATMLEEAKGGREHCRLYLEVFNLTERVS